MDERKRWKTAKKIAEHPSVKFTTVFKVVYKWNTIPILFFVRLIFFLRRFRVETEKKVRKLRKNICRFTHTSFLFFGSHSQMILNGFQIDDWQCCFDVVNIKTCCKWEREKSFQFFYFHTKFQVQFYRQFPCIASFYCSRLLFDWCCSGCCCDCPATSSSSWFAFEEFAPSIARP